MKLRAKIIKRLISMLCAVSLSTSFVITSVGAVDTTKAEAVFSMQYLNSLPKPGEPDFDKFKNPELIYRTEKIDESDKNNVIDENYKKIPELLEEHEWDVLYPDGKNKYKIVKETIKEKEEYDKLKKVVEDLREKVKKRTEISKHGNLPEEMRLAKAIYRWVAKTIPYDYNSLKVVNNVKLRKPQDALYVFANETGGVCAGKANLVNLMMRLAGIPSVVVVSETHAFNAIYLKDTVNNREGWTLIDSTWAGDESDMEMQLGQEAEKVVNKREERINKMTKGIAEVNGQFMEDNFAMCDMYAKAINLIVNTSYISLNKKCDIEGINKKLEEYLKEMNAILCSDNNKFKFNKIRFFESKNGKYLLEYETNISEENAENFYNEVQKNKLIVKAKEMTQLHVNKLSQNNFDGLDGAFANAVNNINRLNDRRKLKISKEYCKEFQTFCEDLLKENKVDLMSNLNVIKENCKKNVNNALDQQKKEIDKREKDKINAIVKDMNEKIKVKIETLNQKYKDIIKIKSFNICAMMGGDMIKIVPDVTELVSVDMELDLPLEDAEKVIKTGEYLLDKKKRFFPAFYGKTLSFKEANEGFIDMKAHKIEDMVLGNWYDFWESEKRSRFDLKINGVKYKLLGEKEGEREGFKVIGNTEYPLENVVILPDLVGLGIDLQIGSGIRSLILKGEETIDWSHSAKIESVDVTESKKYTAVDGKLYLREADGSRGEEVVVRSGTKFVDRRNIAANEEKVKDDVKKVDDNTKKVNNDVKKVVVNNDSNKKRLDDMYNKAKEIIGRLNKSISDLKDWLSKEHKVDLENGVDLTENKNVIDGAKSIINEINQLIKSAEDEIGNGYTDVDIAKRVNLSLLRKETTLKKEINKFKTENSAKK